MIIGVHQHQTGQRGEALEEEAPDRGRSGEHQRLDAGGDVRVEAQVVHWTARSVQPETGQAGGGGEQQSGQFTVFGEAVSEAKVAQLRQEERQLVDVTARGKDTVKEVKIKRLQAALRRFSLSLRFGGCLCLGAVPGHQVVDQTGDESKLRHVELQRQPEVLQVRKKVEQID